MKKLVLLLAMLSIVGLRAEEAPVQETPPSEALKAMLKAVETKAGDITEVTGVKEDALKKVEDLAAQGKKVDDAVNFLESRIEFDPSKAESNKARLERVRKRLKAAKEKSDAVAAAKAA